MNEIGFDSLDIYNSKSELWFAGKAHCDLTTGDLLFTFVNESAEQAIEFKIEAIELNGNIYNSVSKEVSCNLKLSPQKQLNLSDFAKTKFYYKGQDLMPKKDDIHVIEIKHENKPGLNNNIGTNLPQGIKMPMHHAGGITHYHYTLHILNPEEQIPFLTKQIKLLNEEQAEFLVNKSRAKGATLVFGGSCINTFGQQKETTNTLTDLNLGFINISPRLIARIIDEFNTLFAKEPVNHPIIKHKWIYPGSQPNSLAKILSPEEFFLRSGKTINGEIFKATGFIKVNPGGTIEIGLPEENQNLTLNHTEPTTNTLNLQDIAWDKGYQNNAVTLNLTLGTTDLKKLSEKVNQEYLNASSEQTDNFKDVEPDLVPTDTDTFITKPALLKTYLNHPLWKRFLILTILENNFANDLKEEESTRGTWYVTHFINWQASGNNWQLTLVAVKGIANKLVKPIVTNIEQEIRNEKQETSNEKQETRSEEQETRSEEQETRNEKQETKNEKQETRSEKQETRDEKQETRSEKQETGNEKQETKDEKHTSTALSAGETQEMIEHLTAETQVPSIYHRQQLPRSIPLKPNFTLPSVDDFKTIALKRFVYIKVSDIESLNINEDYFAILSSVSNFYSYRTSDAVVIIITKKIKEEDMIEFKVKNAFHLPETGSLYLVDFIYSGKFRSR